MAPRPGTPDSIEKSGDNKMTHDSGKYQLKLYSGTTDDIDVFIRKMSILLEISRSEMISIMVDLPVVVKRNLSREKADFYKDTCESFGGLCLVEPMQDELEHVFPVTLREKTAVHKLWDAWQEWDSDFRARMYFALLIAGAVLLSSIVTVGYSLSVAKILRGPTIAVKDPGSGASDPVASRTSAINLDRAKRVDLSLRVEELEGQLQSLQFLYDQANQSLRQVSRSNTASRRDIFDRGREVVELQNRISKVYAEIQAIRRRLEPV
jgi:hypothetical protein